MLYSQVDHELRRSGVRAEGIDCFANCFDLHRLFTSSAEYRLEEIALVEAALAPLEFPSSESAGDRNSRALKSQISLGAVLPSLSLDFIPIDDRG